MGINIDNDDKMSEGCHLPAPVVCRPQRVLEGRS